MKYWVTVHGKTVEVDVNGDTVRVDGREVDAEIEVNPGSAVVNLTLRGVQSVLAVDRADAMWTVSLAGETAAVRVETERSRRLADAGMGGKGGRGSGLVRAPMPGLVLRVDVSEGDQVSAGDGLLVLEAMKMENVIKAAVGGRITRVHVAQGAAVEKAALLIDIDRTS